ncbi:hypothetical protein E4413_04540 [Leptospira interrogans]|nr:hypothetical protein C5473_07645 [Leptospira interrogans serovar Weerasinghe]QCO40277.1 hypothetical protein E4413_04540 [Leptospira interrogans]
MIVFKSPPSHNFVSSLRSESLMRSSLRTKATLLCHSVCDRSLRLTQASFQSFRAFRRASGSQTSKSLFR